MILNLDDLPAFRSTLTNGVVVTNGCFDILHFGHSKYLEAAKELGRHLIVGVNSDQSVRMLKGEGRPINNEKNRAGLVSKLASVNTVCIFHGMRCEDFLRAARPNVYVKAGDYSLETLDKGEREVLELLGSQIKFIPIEVHESTSEILKRLCR